MKFKIYSTSGEMEKYPDWEKLQEKYPMEKKQRVFVDGWGTEQTIDDYFIEINSMEELLELCEFEDIIIHNKGYSKDNKDYFHIEIYDYYRE